MPKQMLTIFLRGVDDTATIVGDSRTANELLCVGEEVSPLREQQVDNVQVFALRLRVGALR